MFSTEKAEIGGQTEKPLTSRLDSIMQTPLISARASTGMHEGHSEWGGLERCSRRM